MESDDLVQQGSEANTEVREREREAALSPLSPLKFNFLSQVLEESYNKGVPAPPAPQPPSTLDIPAYFQTFPADIRDYHHIAGPGPPQALPR